MPLPIWPGTAPEDEGLGVLVLALFFDLLVDFLLVEPIAECEVLALPVSAELPVLAVLLVLLEDMPLLVPLVGLAPPCDDPAPPCPAPVLVPALPLPLPPEEPPAPPDPPAPPLPCACAMPIALRTASVAAIIRIACFICVVPRLVVVSRSASCQHPGARAMPRRACHRTEGLGALRVAGGEAPVALTNF